MGKLLLVLMMCMLGFSFCCTSKEIYLGGEQKPHIEINKRMLYNSVARLFASYKYKDKDDKEKEAYMNGSAFAVNKDYLMTAAHVCKDLYGKKDLVITIIYLGPNEKLYGTEDVKIFKFDTKDDLCLLESKGHPLMPVKFSNRRQFYVREKVMTIGGPKGIFPIETEGFVALNIVEKDSSDLNGNMITSIPIYGGNSGGAVFDESGDCIGVLIAGDHDYEHIGYITRVEKVLKFIRNAFKK